jgi:N-methylhydantoinase B
MTFGEALGTASPSKFTNVVLRAGDQVMIDSPGGGGYGPPEQRDPERVRHDVEEGLVSPQAAREFYKVALVKHAGRWDVDEAATAALRAT